jgi:endonuclease YncB( thermonuclease family)
MSTTGPQPLVGPTWEYPGQLERVIDGDTIVMILDLGMHTYRHERLRVARVDAPEIATPAGKVAASYTTQWMGLVSNPNVLPVGTHFHRVNISGVPDPEWPFTVRTTSQDDYGRWIAEIWRLTDNHNLSDDLLASNQAVPWPKRKGA